MGKKAGHSMSVSLAKVTCKGLELDEGFVLGVPIPIPWVKVRKRK
jgi:hypothetical protein